MLKMDEVILDALADPLSPRIILIELPPRHGKSFFLSKWFPTWYLGMYPENNVILASHTASFSKKFGRSVRDTLAEVGYEYFGIRLQRDNKSASEWSIRDHGGSMVTAGIGSAVLGRGTNCLIIDDPIKDAEEVRSAGRMDAIWEWWDSTASTRREPGAITIVIAQRWHERDLTGRLLAAAADGTGEPVRRLHLPAIAGEDDELGRKPGEALWPERFPISRLEAIKNSKSAYFWNALYDQNPTQHEGAEWPDEYFGPHILTEFWPDTFDMFVVALDPSKGKTDRSDYSSIAGVGLSGGKLWIDCNIKRRPVSQMVSDAFWFCSGRAMDAFVIEANSFQELLAPEFDRVTTELQVPPLPIHLVENTVNKETRINRLGPYLARKQIVIRDNEGGRLLLRQLKEHPIGHHDDGPDSVEMALRKMIELSHAGIQQEPEVEFAGV
jgi:hypothetical protein